MLFGVFFESCNLFCKWAFALMFFKYLPVSIYIRDWVLSFPLLANAAISNGIIFLAIGMHHHFSEVEFYFFRMAIAILGAQLIDHELALYA